MIKKVRKVLAVTLAFIAILGCMSISACAIIETSMAPVYDSIFTVSNKDYVEIPFASEMYDKVATDKQIAIYHSDEPTYMSFYDTDDFEYALESGKITYVTSISAEKAEIRKNAHNIYGSSFNGFRLYWEDENFSNEGYYLICLESGTLVSEDGEYGNAPTYLADVKGPSTDFFTQLIDSIKAFFEGIIEWFKNLFSF